MTDQSLFDSIAELLPPEQREPYYRDMAHLRNLHPGDEILLVCRAMGFLALITRETPERIATQRADIERILEESIRTIQDTHQTTFNFYSQVQARIESLPSEIETGIDSAAIAIRIGEGIRQCFNSTGLPETADGLRIIASHLQAAMKDFSRVAGAFSHPQSGVTFKLNQALPKMQQQLGVTTQYLNAQVQELRWSMIRGVGFLCLGCIDRKS